jgi:hypothetical protein
MAETNNHKPPVTPPMAGLSKSPDSDMLEPGEEIVTVVRRSFIGLLGIYLVAIAAVLAIFTLIIALTTDSVSAGDGYEIPTEVDAIMVLGATFLVLILFAATYIYRQSRLLITDRSLVQITQKSLFIRKVSRLSFSNVEDVSAEQRGILASLFGYGTLMVQTAGERDNFIFNLCPKPNQLADRIIEARQKYADTVQDDDQ